MVEGAPCFFGTTNNLLDFIYHDHRFTFIITHFFLHVVDSRLHAVLLAGNLIPIDVLFLFLNVEVAALELAIRRVGVAARTPVASFTAVERGCLRSIILDLQLIESSLQAVTDVCFVELEFHRVCALGVRVVQIHPFLLQIVALETNLSYIYEGSGLPDLFQNAYSFLSIVRVEFTVFVNAADTRVFVL